MKKDLGVQENKVISHSSFIKTGWNRLDYLSRKGTYMSYFPSDVITFVLLTIIGGSLFAAAVYLGRLVDWIADLAGELRYIRKIIQKKFDPGKEIK